MKTEAKTQATTQAEIETRIAEILTEHNQRLYLSMGLPAKLATAIKNIDHFFGAGYAKKHPELVGQCVQSLSLDEMMGLGNIEDAIKEAGNTSGLEDALNKIAEALAHFGEPT